MTENIQKEEFILILKTKKPESFDPGFHFSENVGLKRPKAMYP